MTYDQYAAVDEFNKFSPPVRQAFAGSTELATKVNTLIDDDRQSGEFENKVTDIIREKGAATNTPILHSPNGLRRFRADEGRVQFQQRSIVLNADSIGGGVGSEDILPVVDADMTVTRTRSWFRQTKRIMDTYFGGSAGEGYVYPAGIGGQAGISVDDRWVYAVTSNPGLAAGPFAQGRRLAAGNHATAAAQTAPYIDVLGYSGGGGNHICGLEVNGVWARPSVLTADARAGVIGAGKWAVSSTNTLLTNSGVGLMTITKNTAAGAASALYGEKFPVVPGQVYVAELSVLLTAGTSRGYTLNYTFYDASNVAIGVKTSAWTGRTAAAGVGAMGTGFVTAPAGAATVEIELIGSAFDIGQSALLGDFDFVPVKRIPVSGSGDFYSFRSTAGASNQSIKVKTAPYDTTDWSGVILRQRIDGGFVFDQIWRGGATTSDATGIAGTTAQQQQRLYSIVDLMGSVAPASLLILAFGANDKSQGLAPSVFRSNLLMLGQRMIDYGGCVLLIAGPRFSTGTEELLYDEMRNIAETTDHYAFLDLAEAWGTNAESQALGFMNNTLGIHPNLAGHGDYGRIVADALLRQTITPV